MEILSIERVWEDCNFFEIEVCARSELISAKVRSYTDKRSITELASHLQTFPKAYGDRYKWENGGKGSGSTPFVSLEFECADRLGHIVIEVYMEIDDGGNYDKHNCCFFIETDPGLLNDFGKSLLSLNREGIGRKAVLNRIP